MAQIRFVEDIYYDFLYDCYRANRRLSPEDWLLYGRELHHIEIPNCLGGPLGPLNEQYLTTYQHWIAGVLQSELVGHKCFAFVPVNALPPILETLRNKWSKLHITKNLHTPERHEKRRANKKSADQLASNIPYPQRKPSRRSEQASKILGNPVILTTPQGQVIKYDSIKLACRVHSLHPGHLREVAQGKRKQHKGFKAKFI